MFKSITTVISTASLALLACSTSAMEIEFDLANIDSRDGVHWWNHSYSTNVNYSEEGVNLSVSGWSYRSSWWNGVENKITQDWVGSWGHYGLGVEKQFSPEHSIDNSRGDYDMLLLSFDQAVALDEIGIGWQYSRSGADATVMAFTGDQSTSNVTSAFAGNAWEDLLDSDWSVIGDSYSVSTSNPTSVNESGLLSRFWLVGAYNEHVADSGASKHNDFFKLSSVNVKVNPVPLPGSLVLFGSALLFFGSINRKRKKA